MIVTLIIIFLLVSGWVNGVRRGFVLQVIHLAGFIGSLIIAWFLYDDLAPHLAKIIPAPGSGNSTWTAVENVLPFQTTFYNVISFIIVLIVARLIIGMIGRTIDGFAKLPILRSFNKLLGGVLGLAETYLIVFIAIALFFFIPGTEHYVRDSGLAMTILEKTPYLSDTLKQFLP
ncbi:CvpA family protein [Aciduricibacillus chroicocephali]|uniref:CvpA family protein n=1 Tax=Aciduricibacillus chroicocephali TaxID=3054939 RepID=A0ABY9KVG1_9BACI|nr:CvpA family protein [Bacillaceae bacterium 44XB]